MTTLSFHIDDEQHQKLLKLAEATDRSKSYILRKALEAFLHHHEIPNAQTRKVIDEARAGKNLTKIDNFSEFLETL